MWTSTLITVDIVITLRYNYSLIMCTETIFFPITILYTTSHPFRTSIISS